MSRDRVIQLVALLVMLVSLAAGGSLLPSMLQVSRTHYLRYTDEPIEGAPPVVALGMAMGALRGVIVDYLWLKATIMKEHGQYYELMHDAELITKLQPRFPEVWAFLGHNAAYNVSVTLNSEEERWKWVQDGINLVRNQGLRYNPNDLQLHRELAFWFKHKIEGVSDDAHLYYKREFRREWYRILGEPPLDQQEHIAWIKKVADAPETLGECGQDVNVLVARLQSSLAPYEQRFHFALDKRFLQAYAEWHAAKLDSVAASVLGTEKAFREKDEFFRTLDDLAGDPKLAEAWDKLIAHVRKRVLRDEYNMDPQKMYEYTRDLGPIDWRHGEAQALYWSRMGSDRGEHRIIDVEEVYRRINNDRIQLQAMQSLAKGGRISFDYFDDLSNRIPAKFPEPRWIDTIWKEFDRLYVKYDKYRGMGGEVFIDFLENFMTAAVHKYYRSGNLAKAQEILDRLDRMFGRGGTPPSLRFAKPLDAFVRDETRGEYEFQPELARDEVGMAMRQGLIALAQDDSQSFEGAMKFAAEVTDYFKGNDYNNYVNRFGEGRMKDILGSLAESLAAAINQTIRDPSVPLPARMTIWSKLDKYAPRDKAMAYNEPLRNELEAQLQLSYLGRSMTVDQAFPKPPGWDEAQAAMRREQERAREQQDRDRPAAPTHAPSP